MQQCSFEDEGKMESSCRYKSKIVLMLIYADKEMQSLDETCGYTGCREKYPEICCGECLRWR